MLRRIREFMDDIVQRATVARVVQKLPDGLEEATHTWQEYTLGKKADRNFYLPHYNAEATKRTAQKRKLDEALKMANDGRSPVRNRRNSAGAASKSNEGAESNEGGLLSWYRTAV